MSDDMPEKIWADPEDCQCAKCEIAGMAEYLLKSTVDAEREADSKTIRELAAVLERLACLGNGESHGNSDGNVIAQQALAAHAPRIAEAQPPTQGDEG